MDDPSNQRGHTVTTLQIWGVDCRQKKEKNIVHQRYLDMHKILGIMKGLEKWKQ